MKNPFIAKLAMLTGLSVLLGSGCSTAPKVQTKYESSNNFNVYKSFAILSIKSESGRNPELVSLAEETARQVLVSRGFVERGTNDADVAFRLRGESLRRVEFPEGSETPPTSLNAGTGWKSYEARENLDPRTVYDRTLFIEAVDKKSGKQVWLGWLEASSSSRVDPKRLQQGVRAILSHFPP
jgi:hypothetical protein